MLLALLAVHEIAVHELAVHECSTYSNLSYFGDEKTPPCSVITGEKSTKDKGKPLCVTYQINVNISVAVL